MLAAVLLTSLLLGHQAVPSAAQPAEGTLEILATLESVLRRNPDHPGANHY